MHYRGPGGLSRRKGGGKRGGEGGGQRPVWQSLLLPFLCRRECKCLGRDQGGERERGRGKPQEGGGKMRDWRNQPSYTFLSINPQTRSIPILAEEERRKKKSPGGGKREKKKGGRWHRLLCSFGSNRTAEFSCVAPRKGRKTTERRKEKESNATL